MAPTRRMSAGVAVSVNDTSVPSVTGEVPAATVTSGSMPCPCRPAKLTDWECAHSSENMEALRRSDRNENQERLPVSAPCADFDCRRHRRGWSCPERMFCPVGNRHRAELRRRRGGRPDLCDRPGDRAAGVAGRRGRRRSADLFPRSGRTWADVRPGAPDARRHADAGRHVRDDLHGRGRGRQHRRRRRRYDRVHHHGSGSRANRYGAELRRCHGGRPDLCGKRGDSGLAAAASRRRQRSADLFPRAGGTGADVRPGAPDAQRHADAGRHVRDDLHGRGRGRQHRRWRRRYDRVHHHGSGPRANRHGAELR